MRCRKYENKTLGKIQKRIGHYIWKIRIVLKSFRRKLNSSITMEYELYEQESNETWGEPICVNVTGYDSSLKAKDEMEEVIKKTIEINKIPNGNLMLIYHITEIKKDGNEEYVDSDVVFFSLINGILEETIDDNEQQKSDLIFGA